MFGRHSIRTLLVSAIILTAAVFPAGAIVWEFNTDGDTEGWAADFTVASAEAVGGDLVVTAETYTEGGAPSIVITGLSIDASSDHFLYVDVSRPTTEGAYSLGSSGDYADMKVYFDNGSGFSEADTKYLISHATDNGQYNTIYDLATASGGGNDWTGTITALQLSMNAWDAGNTMSGQTFHINRIAITDTPVPYYWDWDENLPEGWLLTDAMTMNWTGGAMELSGSAGLVYSTKYSWWSTGRMFFSEDRDHYLRIDCAAANDGVDDAKWLGIHIKDEGMSVDYATGWTILPNTPVKPYIIDLAAALSPNWADSTDLQGSLMLDTTNWANFAAENTTLAIDYLAFSDGMDDADGDGVNDATELGDETDPGDAASYTEIPVPDLAGLTEEEALAALEAAGLVGSVSTENSDTVPEGEVISQTPGSGSNHGGVPVEVVVSAGPAQAANVPVVHGAGFVLLAGLAAFAGVCRTRRS